jgi:flagellar motor switch protein FliN
MDAKATSSSQSRNAAGRAGQIDHRARLLPDALREVLQLAPGSVVKLDQAAQHPVNLYANQKQIARGEVVVVNDCYGVKITELFGAAQ